ncbi:MAG: hypothetical protein ACLP9L_36385 [Thermoguttaceae bacterium]
MRLSMLGVALAAGLSLAAIDALAQPAPTLQLPTFSFAGVGTTVMVPDGGATFLGGVNRASDGRNEFGVPGITLPGFQNRGIGQDRSTSSFWVTATIHDFDAMDQALLNTPSPNGVARIYPTVSRGLPEAPAAIAGRTFRRTPVNLAGSWQVEPTAPAPVSDVAVEQANRAARQATRAEEADGFFARGQQAEAEGKPNVAKIYYQMAIRRATGDVKKQVQARLDVVSGRNNALAKSAP